MQGHIATSPCTSTKFAHTVVHCSITLLCFMYVYQVQMQSHIAPFHVCLPNSHLGSHCCISCMSTKFTCRAQTACIRVYTNTHVHTSICNAQHVDPTNQWIVSHKPQISNLFGQSTYRTEQVKMNTQQFHELSMNNFVIKCEPELCEPELREEELCEAELCEAELCEAELQCMWCRAM